MNEKYKKFNEKYGETLLKEHSEKLSRKQFVTFMDSELEGKAGYCIMRLEDGEIYRVYFRTKAKYEDEKNFGLSLEKYGKNLLNGEISLYHIAVLEKEGEEILVVRGVVGGTFCDFELGLTLDDLDEEGNLLLRKGEIRNV